MALGMEESMKRRELIKKLGWGLLALPLIAALEFVRDHPGAKVEQEL